MESIDSLIEDLASGDPKRIYRANLQFDKITAEAGNPGNEARRKEVAKAIADAIAATKTVQRQRGRREVEATEPKFSDKVRSQLCRHLAAVGGADEVKSLVEALKDLEVREMARWALDRIAGPEATEAIANAANDVGPEFRVGATSALGQRKDPKAVEALRKLAADADSAVRVAAAEALSNHADAAHDELIKSAGAHPASPRVTTRIIRSRIRLAENLAKAGQGSAAKKVYQGVLADNPPDIYQKAAKRALENLG